MAEVDSGHRRILGPALLMGGTRALNIGVGLLLIPMMLHYLGPTAFAAWAIYSGGGVMLASLDFGIARTLVKFLAHPLAEGAKSEVDAIAVNGLLITAAAYGITFVILLPVIDPLANWLHLPDGPLLDAPGMFMLLIVATGLRGLLGLGGLFFYAARNFRASALQAFLQPLISNLAAMTAAIIWQRLDLVLLVYWGAQLAVVGGFFLYASRYFRWCLNPAYSSIAGLRELVSHGFQVQLSVWAVTVHFQFDKFILAGFVGLEAVIPYEIANRALMTLRSIPLSAIETLLPGASLGTLVGQKPGNAKGAVFWMTGSMVLLFILLPAALSPLLLYAWAGVTGYAAKGVFLLLAAGIAIELLALPAVIRMQAEGRPGIYAVACWIGVLFHLPGSIGLVYLVDPVQAPVAAALAMMFGIWIGQLWFLHGYGRQQGLSMGAGRYLLVPILICLSTCFVVLGAAQILVVSILNSDGLVSRIEAGVTAILLYIICVAALALFARHLFFQQPQQEDI